jgi:hypothetical protein
LPRTISNKDLWKAMGQQDVNLEIRKRKFGWTGHTLRKDDEEIPKAATQWNPHGSRKGGRPKIDGEDRLSNKQAEAGMNLGS